MVTAWSGGKRSAEAVLVRDVVDRLAGVHQRVRGVYWRQWARHNFILVMTSCRKCVIQQERLICITCL